MNYHLEVLTKNNEWQDWSFRTFKENKRPYRQKKENSTLSKDKGREVEDNDKEKDDTAKDKIEKDMESTTKETGIQEEKVSFDATTLKESAISVDSKEGKIKIRTRMDTFGTNEAEILKWIFEKDGVTTDTVVEYINAFREIAFRNEYRENVDESVWSRALRELKRKGIVLEKEPDFFPYVRLDVPSEKDVKEYNDNNAKMEQCLSKEDKSKRVNVSANQTIVTQIRSVSSHQTKDFLFFFVVLFICNS